MGLDAFSLSGSVAVVTGGSRGIGEAIAVAMAEAGAAVAPVARSAEDLRATAERVREAGGDAVPVVADVAEDDGVEAAFDAAEDELGPVDVLVNNAGTNPYFGSSEDLDVGTWETIMAVNATGAFRCSRSFAARVFDRGATGSIVNVGSVGSLVGLPYQTAYVASKHALAGMTRSLAVEWAPDIRVNALAPGYVKTELTEGVREHPEIREEILDGVPQGRFAEPAEVADAAVYLASDAASFATGDVHAVDGGFTAK